MCVCCVCISLCKKVCAVVRCVQSLVPKSVFVQRVCVIFVPSLEVISFSVQTERYNKLEQTVQEMKQNEVTEVHKHESILACLSLNILWEEAQRKEGWGQSDRKRNKALVLYADAATTTLVQISDTTVPWGHS